MLKNTILFLILSAIVAFFPHAASGVFIYIDERIDSLQEKLEPIFRQIYIEASLTEIIILILLPIAIIGIPALLYRLIKKRSMPYFFRSIWGTWFVLMLTHVLLI